MPWSLSCSGRVQVDGRKLGGGACEFMNRKSIFDRVLLTRTRNVYCICICVISATPRLDRVWVYRAGYVCMMVHHQSIVYLGYPILVDLNIRINDYLGDVSGFWRSIHLRF